MIFPSRKALVFTLLLGTVTACSTPELDPTAPGRQRGLDLHLEGGPGPTVVFESGLGDGASVWNGVAARLPQTFRRVSYDRPGYGWSRSTAQPRDPAAIARDLHAALQARAVPPPYLLVGHSLGGLYVQAFARLFPGETAGLVLVDPTHPDQWTRMQSDAPTDHRVVSALSVLFPRHMRAEFEASKDAAAWHRLPPLPPRLPAVVLSAEESSMGESAQFKNLKRALQAETAASIPGAAHRWIRSPHYIQKHRPEAVAEAISEVASRTRAAQASSAP